MFPFHLLKPYRLKFFTILYISKVSVIIFHKVRESSDRFNSTFAPIKYLFCGVIHLQLGVVGHCLLKKLASTIRMAQY